MTPIEADIMRLEQCKATIVERHQLALGFLNAQITGLKTALVKEMREGTLLDQRHSASTGEVVAAPDPIIDYRCKRCGEIVPRATVHIIESCKCGAIQVDRGWYGNRVLFDGKAEDAFEEVRGKQV